MRQTTLVATQIAALLLLSQVPAAAQVEIGVAAGGLGVLTAEGSGGINSAGLRVTVPMTPRFAVEGNLDIINVQPESVDGFYGVLIRQRIIRMSKGNTHVFVTYGTMGGYSHQRQYEHRYRGSSGGEVVVRSRAHTWISPPIVPMLGVGVQQTVARRLDVRFDVQGFIAPPYAMGGRLTAGVSVPLGRDGR